MTKHVFTRAHLRGPPVECGVECTAIPGDDIGASSCGAGAVAMNAPSSFAGAPSSSDPSSFSSTSKSQAAARPGLTAGAFCPGLLVGLGTDTAGAAPEGGMMGAGAGSGVGAGAGWDAAVGGWPA